LYVCPSRSSVIAPVTPSAALEDDDATTAEDKTRTTEEDNLSFRTLEELIETSRLLLEGKLAELIRNELLLLTTEEDDLSFWELEEPTESLRLLLERPSIGVEEDKVTNVAEEDNEEEIPANDDEESSLGTNGLLESSSPQAVKIKVETKAK
jgi:hypothetical protein